MGRSTRSPRGSNGFELLGEPAGIERLGGIDFDTSVLAQVRTTLAGHLEALDVADPATQGAFERLRAECVDPKETLSHDTATSANVSLPGLHTAVRLTRVEFEDMIRPAVTERVDAQRKAVRLAGVEPCDLRAALVVTCGLG